MNELTRLLVLGLLYLLAAPVYLVLWLARLPKEVEAMETIARGAKDCPYCDTENPLARMAQCPVCHAVEPNTVLRCSWCGEKFDTITCEGCGATIRVP